MTRQALNWQCLHGVDRIRAVELRGNVAIGQELLVLGLEETITATQSVFFEVVDKCFTKTKTHPAGVSANTKRPIFAGKSIPILRLQF
jgi:hypothetical protein